MPVTAFDELGRALSVPLYSGSNVLSTAPASVSYALSAGVKLVTVTAFVASWVCIAPGAAAASATGGCSYLPADCPRDLVGVRRARDEASE